MNHTQTLARIVDNVEQVMIGKRHEIELTLMALLCRGHALIEDVPGVGKTSLAFALARSLGCTFRRIQFTPDIMPADITGFSVWNPGTGAFEYRAGAILSQIVLADEINRAPPKTQSSLLEAMAEKQVTVDGITYRIKEPFIVLATQNPIEYLGTYPLPEAQMDRFFMRISLGYPQRDEEMQMIARFRGQSPLPSLMPVASGEDILALQALCEQVHVDARLYEYVVDLVRHTRNDSRVALGASPRASIALLKGAQAWALYSGRDYVIPDDVQLMAPHVLAHRLVLTQDSRLSGLSQADTVEHVLKSVRVPTR